MSPNITVDGNAEVHPAPERPRKAPELASRSCDDSSLDSASLSSGASSDFSLGPASRDTGDGEARVPPESEWGEVPQGRVGRSRCGRARLVAWEEQVRVGHGQCRSPIPLRYEAIADTFEGWEYSGKLWQFNMPHLCPHDDMPQFLEAALSPINACASVPPMETLVSQLDSRSIVWTIWVDDPLYASFHDDEWGVPVHDDKKLFELLSLSGALAELSWPTILGKRETFRELFASFDPAFVSKFSERKITSLKTGDNIVLSELKLSSIVENAKQILKVVDEFGSFDKYCWSFSNHKPIINRFRYQRQVPVKSPKAEALSKDLIRRGFRSVGPTTVYSFMQAAGMVNDHLISCYRFEECSSVTAAVDLDCYESKQKIADKKLQEVMGLAEQMNGCMLGV